MKHVIYHGNCRDGFGAALAAWMVFGDSAKYIPAQYGDSPPPVGSDDEVYILDFSYPRDQLLALSEKARRIDVLDHHKTAAEALRDLPDSLEEDDSNSPNLFARFNMEKSGAVLAWEYFHTRPVPRLMQFLQDRDLWRWEMLNSREVSAGIDLLHWDFEEWEEHLHDVTELHVKGQIILVYQQKLVAQACSSVMWESIGGHIVPVVNTGTLISEVCEELLRRNLNAPFAACRFDLSRFRVYSLRSRDGSDVDVSMIAKKDGGGGHKHAAGFRVPIS